MRHFQQLSPQYAEPLFHVPPGEFSRDSASDRLAMALGATLYAPAVRPNLAQDIVRRHAEGVMSMVCCLEDAIRDDEVAGAEVNLADQLRRLADVRPDGPLVFVRVRTPDQIYRLAERLGDALGVVSGFVLPKFNANATGIAGLEAVQEIAESTGLAMYAMPVLESPEMVYLESRLRTLVAIRELLDAYREMILAVRVGVTDVCGWYGLRRPADLTAWDLGLVAHTLTDIINLLTRGDASGYVVTGPVWEYFTSGERVLKPQLRASLFDHDPHAQMLRMHLVQTSQDGLIREILLDQANGLIGKTVIHPSHAPAVHALSVVSHEEYCDAVAICGGVDPGRGGGGVVPSAYENKMNEVRPHHAWARRTLLRADLFGVAAEGITFVDFLDACIAAEGATRSEGTAPTGAEDVPKLAGVKARA
jgi:citrate lyase beta subunit